MQPDAWLPLTEYAMRSGISISTLRRKIKSNAIEYRMEDGRYLIRCDESAFENASAFASNDAKSEDLKEVDRVSAREQLLEEQLQKIAEESALRWRALDARVSGLAKKLEIYSEQMAELKMLVKLFEEKLDQRA